MLDISYTRKWCCLSCSASLVSLPKKQKI